MTERKQANTAQAMRFKLVLRCLDEKPVLPINYQYELSAWIYKQWFVKNSGH